jgi:hypothetical protein
MISDLEKAVKLLKENQLTFAAVKENKNITSKQRGVKPLLELLEGNTSLCGFSVADKVIGKAAAFLYVLLSPDKISTGVVSKSALDVLKRNNINVHYDILTDSIRNRDNTGSCPMEATVMDTDDAYKALELIKNKLIELSK